MRTGTYIILRNSGGELDRALIEHEDGVETDLTQALVDTVREQQWIINEGDSIEFCFGQRD